MLWTSAEAQAATGGKARGSWQASGVSIDSRDLQPGDLFIALRDVRDGHDFVSAAFRAGAVAALVSKVPDDVPADAPLLIVDDVQAALEALGRAARQRANARVIAVTGSAGKTTTKEMLRSALAGQGRVHAAHMSLNNHWGVPLTLARMPQETDYALVEIGMNHPGEITPLSRLSRPDVAIITTVAQAHMAAFDGIEGVARAKAEIFDGIVPGGTAILNRDIPTYRLLADAAGDAGLDIVTFGSHEEAGFRLIEHAGRGNVTTVRARLGDSPLLFRISAPGGHLAMNALATLAAVQAVGGDVAVAALDLARWQPPAGRGQRHVVRLDPVVDDLCLELIDESYNANPASMAAAFDVLAASIPCDGVGRVDRGRRIALLTDMLELGDDAPAMHRGIADLPALAAVDKIHAAGPLMRELIDALPYDKRGEWHESAEELAARLHHLLDAGDVVMVKGSKGSKASILARAVLKLDRAGEQ